MDTKNPAALPLIGSPSLVRLRVLPSLPHPLGRRLPSWLKRPLPGGPDFAATKGVVTRSGIATVCQDAKCPNLPECWSRRTATFMILGHKCTRRCHYCSVATARPDPPDADEPQRLARAVGELGLRHAVITAVARDDLPDEGAEHFARCVRAIKARTPDVTVEVLPADLHARSDLIRTVCDAGPDIYNHNVEMVERLTPRFRPQGKYRRSLEVLRIVRQAAPHVITKSGLMLGLGETRDEILRTLDDLRAVGCDVLTIGQYLTPSPEHAPVARFYAPEEFAELADRARERGFAGVASAPFVRSSYHAAEIFEQIQRQKKVEGHAFTRLGGMPSRGWVACLHAVALATAGRHV
jgi:lipoic acid synthetase